MKQGIHPEYEMTSIRCTCGNVIDVRSTKQDMSVQICSECHPFYTGKQRLVDTAGRIERFKKKYANKVTPKTAKAGTAKAEAPKVEASKAEAAPAQPEAQTGEAEATPVNE